MVGWQPDGADAAEVPCADEQPATSPAATRVANAGRSIFMFMSVPSVGPADCPPVREGCAPRATTPRRLATGRLLPSSGRLSQMIRRPYLDPKWTGRAALGAG